MRTIIRSGCYLTHDDGLYARTSPLAGDRGLLPALQVWAQVVSRPEPDLALLTMGRRDVSFDQDIPVPSDLPDSAVTGSTTSTRTCDWARRTGGVEVGELAASSGSPIRAPRSTSGR